MSDSEKQPKASNWKSNALSWGGILLVFLFFRYTDQGTIVQSWLQQGLLYTGIMQPDVRYAEEHDIPASFDLDLVTLAGEPVSLESFRGKTIFMNFWATWCAPCLAEMPFIENLYQDMKDEDVVFLLISTDDNVETARKFVDAKGYTLPNYRLAGRVPDVYNVRTLPTTYVIAPSGSMATVHVGMANYDTRGFRTFLRDMIASGGQQELE
jgi:thiol-disulfide isomerase/thioredoxin